MNKSHIILLPLLLLLLSCTDKEAFVLFDEVESYIHAEPERALEVLEGLDESGLASRRGRARYSLLYTMALDKNWRTPTDESFIQPALDYYCRHGTADDRIKSLYYLGRIQFEGKFYSKAIVSFTRAHSLLDKSHDSRYCGLVNQAIADTYITTYNDAEVLPYLESAYEWFVKYGDKSLSDLTLCSMAGQYTVLKQCEEADSLFRMAIEAGNIPDRMYPSVLCEYALCLIKMSLSAHSPKIEELFSDALELAGSLPDYTFWGAYAYILAYNGKKEKSAEIFRQLGSLCETFLASSGYRDSHKAVYEKVREMIGDISGDTAGQNRFEEMLNSSLGDVMRHFRDDFPSLEWDDYRFFSYIIVGFDATTISVILRMPSQAAVYAKKSRLKKQISSSPSPYREQYLGFFA